MTIVFYLSGICNTNFSFFNRRHHCRGCGMSVCGTHSQGKAEVPGHSIVQRVCDECVSSIRSSHIAEGKIPPMLLYHTHSICVQCSLVEKKGFMWHAGRVMEHKGSVWLCMSCEKHGKHWTRLSSDATFFRKCRAMVQYSPWK